MSTLLTSMIVMPKADKKPAKRTAQKNGEGQGRDYVLDEGAASIGPLRARGVDEPSEKPVMIAARVHPKLQYGLRLLARVQGGTIAQSLEWAINLAMRRTGIGAGHSATTLDELVDTAWEESTEPRRIYMVFERAPELLDFDERGAWGLVRRCDDLWLETYRRFVTEIVDYEEDGTPIEAIVNDEPCEKDDPLREKMMDRKVPIFSSIEPNWETIKKVGVALARAGEIDKFYSLDEIISGAALKKARIS